MSEVQQPLFKTLEEENKEIDPKLAERSNYATFKVNDLVDKDTFQGEIYLSDKTFSSCRNLFCNFHFASPFQLHLHYTTIFYFVKGQFFTKIIFILYML